MDALVVFRRVFLAYAGALGLLGAVTLAWALTEALVLDNATLATAWFAVAGAGTLLTVALILRYRRDRGPASPGPSESGRSRTND